jgi:hypothetical protein
MMTKVEMLELRIQQLEKFEKGYMRLVEGHAKNTLEPHDDKTPHDRISSAPRP